MLKFWNHLNKTLINSKKYNRLHCTTEINNQNINIMIDWNKSNSGIARPAITGNSMALRLNDLGRLNPSLTLRRKL